MNEDPIRLIDYFDDFEGDNQYQFLSNFYEVPGGVTAGVTVYGGELVTLTAPTTEHIFAAGKAYIREDEAAILQAKNPGTAKRMGRACQLAPDWEERKLLVMRQVLAAKFDWTHHPDLAGALVDTRDAWLVEGTHWGDQVWGVDLDKPGRPGLNWLGHLLMARRAELRSAL